MQKHSISGAEFTKAFGIAMQALGPGRSDAGPAFSYGVVDVGAQSDRHLHDEQEAFVVIAGQGAVRTDGDLIDVASGDVIIFDAFDQHILANTGDVPLQFVDIYWKDAAAAATSAQSYQNLPRPQGPTFVFSTPPTPNGDLHLGHLSGPYFGADVYTRFLRASGVDAYHLTGSDDFQSYVQTRADADGTSPGETAAHYAREIRDTLALLDCEVDNFLPTHGNDDYHAFQRACFAKLEMSDAVAVKSSLAAFDPDGGRYLYEPDISGVCPNCSCPAGGNICEECGFPNLCHDLVTPVAAKSRKSPSIAQVSRVEIDLAETLDQTRSHLKKSTASPRILALLESIAASELKSIPITHPSSWGIRPEGRDDQVIWVWPEMAFGFLFNIQSLGERVGRDWRADAPQDNWKIVHFFGFDNSFYHAILYPPLYRMAFPGWAENIDYHVNEFYLLDDRKFSTSRRHAVWGKEILNTDTVDVVRLHLGLTRPEDQRTNFSLAALKSTDDLIFRGVWLEWLSALADGVDGTFGGQVPDAGDWSPRDISFLSRMNEFHAEMGKAYGREGFSIRRAAAVAVKFAEDCLTYGRTARNLAGHDALFARYRTAIALQCTAAALLTSCIYPLMPRFAQAVGQGIAGTDVKTWPHQVSRIAPGTGFNISNAISHYQSHAITAF